MNKQKKILIFPCASGMISNFLPWATAPIIGDLTGFLDKVGWITFALFGTAFAICLGGNHYDPLIGKFKIGLTAAIGLATTIGVVEILDLKNILPFDKANEVYGKVISSSFEVGIGLYMEALSGIAALLVAFFFYDNPSRS